MNSTLDKIELKLNRLGAAAEYAERERRRAARSVTNRARKKLGNGERRREEPLRYSIGGEGYAASPGS